MASKKTINVGLWTRNNIYSFEVVPSLAGAFHEFQHRGVTVRIELPPKPSVKDWQNEDSRMNCWGYWEKKGRKVPESYNVNDVDVYLRTGQRRVVRSDWIGAVRDDRFTQRERDRYQKFLDKFAPIADSAYDRWLDLMRWKTDVPTIGQSTHEEQRFGRNHYLTDSKSGRRFFAGPFMISVSRDPKVTKRAWNKVQQALDKNLEVPVWRIYFASACQRMALEHDREFIIDLAIATETVVRSVVTRFLRQPRNAAFENKVGRIAITSIIGDWSKLGFKSAAWNRLSGSLRVVRQIVEKRNGIMHRGSMSGLTANERLTYRDAVRSFIEQSERELKQSAWRST